MSRLIYLATPYNDPSPFIREERFHAACSVASKLILVGVHLFCPIAHTHPIASKSSNLLPGCDYWQEYDRLMLTACDELWIVQMSGWDRSAGIEVEIGIAAELGKRILYLHPTSLDRKGTPWVSI